MFEWLRRPRRLIVFVCTANVCRSPFAQAVLREQLKRRGAARRFHVVSAGTRVAQPGRPPDPRLRPFLASRGVPFPRSRARRVTDSMLARAERVYVMTRDHREELTALESESSAGVVLLGTFLAAGGDDIADPYFADGETYRAVLESIEEAVVALAQDLAAGS